ncbi:hypothetical protein BK011_09355 [Tenericutes bacterium MZ-XQ]|nr:hypothetical protein BK011_09355 [Tenericutes bacterium MZ-XQ]
MIVNHKIDTITIGEDKLKFHMLPSGKIHQITYEDKMINQLRMLNHEDMFTNIYLRIKKNGSYKYVKIIGNSAVSYDQTHIYYHGKFEDITYHMIIHILDNKWFIDLGLVSEKLQEQVDVFYVQDIGIKHGGAIRNNEAYNAQYIDHKVFKNNDCYVICSKQNQGNDEYLQIGSLTKTIGYATDGYQFFGLSSKFDGKPAALNSDMLPNEIYQYEFACASLQSEVLTIHQDMTHIIFYGHFVPKFNDSVDKLHFMNEVQNSYKQLSIENNEVKHLKHHPLRFYAKDIFESKAINTSMLDELYPNRYFEEKDKHHLLSFFTKNHEHVVLKEKERHVERMHGHIILSENNNFVGKQTLASTSFMPGVFNAQLVIGNTSFHKFISNSRNMLNLQRANGQRIYIYIDGKYQLLGMPAVYEMGFNYAKWLYVINDDVLEIKTYTSFTQPQLNLEIKSHHHIDYDMLITQQVVMGHEELALDYEVHKDNHTFIFEPSQTSMMSEHFPDSKMYMHIEKGKLIDQPFEQMFEESLFILNIVDHKAVINIYGEIDRKVSHKSLVFEDEKVLFQEYYQENINHFSLSIDQDNRRHDEVDKFNTIMYWYTHDALIHYASPHGLEQFGGAAWGTRDVCQGPFEYFLSLRKYDVAKAILIKVFRQQFFENGDWPQWFMFDAYRHIQAKESHGDIIVWPIRSLALYLKATADDSILDEMVSYTHYDTSKFTEEKETILDHVKKTIQTILMHYIPNTHLSSYGDGDWDDTLQPANPELRKSMVSGWTTALTYETFLMLGHLLEHKDQVLATFLKEEAALIKNDYQKYVIKDKIPAGFLHFGDHGIRYIIHPNDDVTHMKYRLLPMNRGLISELFDQKQASYLYDVIKKHLYHPDGVRLMDKTVPYHGGRNTYFKRAETSANFGREISLQYVHAHIRFVEAMAALGKKEETWDGLLKINPIQIQDVVKHADYRQANAYFSSSDGAFLNRYEAMKHFDKLLTEDIKVKGGWRVYSSGPGIYINQLISKVLGVDFQGKHLVLDPQLPKELDGLKLNMKIDQTHVTIIYHLNHNGRLVKINGKSIPFDVLSQSYRPGGIKIDSSLCLQSDFVTLEYFE